MSMITHEQKQFKPLDDFAYACGPENPQEGHPGEIKISIKQKRT